MALWTAFALGLSVGMVAGVLMRGAGTAKSERFRRRARLPTSTEHVMDLLRRAHHAAAVCLVGRDTDPIVASAGPMVALKSFDRPITLARLAMGDGRQHVTREPDTIIAVGDGKWGMSVLLGQSEYPTEVIETVSAELRRLLEKLHLDLQPSISQEIPAQRVEATLPPSLNTLPAIASGLCDRARIITGRPTAVVVRNPGTDSASVIAVSHNADRRLLGAVALPESAVGRACLVDGTITAGSNADLFGALPEDRRRRGHHGTAYTLRDGNQGVGALVIFGSDDELNLEVKERVMWLASDTSPRFAAAAAVRQAEERATTDHLTGLPNRMALDRAMADASPDPCAVLYMDLDHFKKINDRFGHAAGDDALRHVAQILRSVLRERDVPARAGGEEFVLWLPETTKSSALEVAERVRRRVEESRWVWEGAVVGLTCSVGVAARPDTTTQVANLTVAADAAMYRAKKAGRNRVEEARAAGE